MTEQENVIAWMRAVLEQCVEKGFVLPIHLVTVSRNGSVLAIRIEDDQEPKVLAEHFEGGVFTLPINFMVTDQRGQAARLVIEEHDKGPRLVH